MSYQEKRKLLIYNLYIKEKNDWERYIRIYNNVFDFQNVQNSLMEQKNSGIIKDFKFSPISINEHHTTLKEFIKKYGDISIADLAVLLKALED